ncbi:MAG: acyl transferase [Bacteroidia bacterium]|nr:acyl transferase [Bacteroidia bacterium]
MPEFDPEIFFAQLYSETRDFNSLEADLWTFQYRHNPAIQAFCKELGTDQPVSVPIGFFKHFEMKTGEWMPETNFFSSGTTGQIPSRHPVKDISLYEKNSIEGFFAFFPRQRYRIMGLLPSYLERSGSSLVHMVKTWIEVFGLPGSGFYLHDFDSLRKTLEESAALGERILLIGVAYALLDFAEEKPIQLPPDSIVIETGGMKGRKEEMIREELHTRLQAGLGLKRIYSEYGMTELMSQAYTDITGRFRPAPTMRVYVSDIHLNRLIEPVGVSGRLHIVDLANVYSCAFIATDDIGKMYPDGTFEVLGRLDTAEMRGCSLMVNG